MSRTRGSPRHSIAVIASLVMLIAVAFSVLSSPPAHADTDGASMSLSVFPPLTCPGEPVQGKACVGFNQQFDVIVSADAIPLPEGYSQYRIWINYGDDLGDQDLNGVVKAATGCKKLGFASYDVAGGPNFDAARVWCSFGLLPPLPSSHSKGFLNTFTLTCTDHESSNLIWLEAAGGPNAGSEGTQYFTGAGAPLISVVPENTDFVVDSITVNCIPLGVGGVALDDALVSQGSTSGSASVWRVATALAALLSVVGAGAFVAVRRRSTH